MSLSGNNILFLSGPEKYRSKFKNFYLKADAAADDDDEMCD